MERYRRGKGKQKLLGSHQKCWIWGRNVVLETLAAGRWQILDLHLSADLEPAALNAALAQARAQGVPVRVQPADTLSRLCHTSEHQGYLARMAAFPYAKEDELLAGLSPTPFCAILDGLQDPYNLGAVIRSAEIFAVEAVFIGARGQTGVTSMVARSSAGAVNRVPLARVADLPALAARLKQRGLALMAASEKATLPIAAVDLRRPVAVVLGSEGRGIRPELIALSDVVARIPQYGAVGSLNAAAAAAIVFYEVRRQRAAAG